MHKIPPAETPYKTQTHMHILLDKETRLTYLTHEVHFLQSIRLISNLPSRSLSLVSSHPHRKYKKRIQPAAAQ